MTGDMAVPVNSFEVSISFDQSFRHFNVPVAASNDDSTAVTPSVKSASAGDERRGERPLRHHGRVLVLGEGRRVAGAPDGLAALELERGDHFVGLAPAVDEHAAVVHDGRRVPFADGLTPAGRQLLGPRGRHGRRGDDAVAPRPAPLRPLAVSGRGHEREKGDDWPLGAWGGPGSLVFGLWWSLVSGSLGYQRLKTPKTERPKTDAPLTSSETPARGTGSPRCCPRAAGAS